jgi:predicted amidophosphoribosyltransferase
MNMNASTNFCANCGTPLAADAKFCDSCGTPVAAVPPPPVVTPPPPPPAPPRATAQTYCPSCGTPNSPSSTFCNSCGARMGAPAGQPTAPAAVAYSPAQPAAVSQSTSGAWWLMPILLFWLGGLIAWASVKKKNKGKANAMLIFGIIWTLVVAFIASRGC